MARRSSNSDKEDYTVGKAKPPKAWQFQPGQSGNPNGRPKGVRSTVEEVKHHLDGSMAVRVDGSSRKMSRRRILVHNLFERAVKGDNRAADILLRYDLIARPAGAGDAMQLTRAEEPDDQAILQQYYATSSDGGGER